MRSWFSYTLLLLAAAVVQAVSSAGSRLLVIMDEDGDRSGYSTFFWRSEG